MINIVSVLFNRNTESENALSDLRSSMAGFSVLTAVVLKKQPQVFLDMMASTLIKQMIVGPPEV